MEHCRLLAWNILVSVQLTYKADLAQVRTQTDQDQPGQDRSGRFPEGGNPVWKWKFISQKACKKHDRVDSESMMRRQQQISLISVVLATDSA